MPYITSGNTNGPTVMIGKVFNFHYYYVNNIGMEKATADKITDSETSVFSSYKLFFQ